MRGFSQLIVGIVFTTFGAAQVTKTVGTSDPNFDYPTIGAAFAAINTGNITDGNGNPADSIAVILMDTVFSESELLLSPPPGQPRAVAIIPADTASFATINITQNLAMPEGLRVDGPASFTLSYVNILLDTAYAWRAAIEIYQAKEWVRPCPFHIFAPTAGIGIEVTADSIGNILIENSSIERVKKGTNVLLPAVCGELFVTISNTVYLNTDTAIVARGGCLTTLNISGNTFDGVWSGILSDSVDADLIVVSGNTATYGVPQNPSAEIQLLSSQRKRSREPMTQGKDPALSHFKDHRGQGHDNVIVVTNNTLTGGDSAGAAFLFERTGEGRIEISGNMIFNVSTAIELDSVGADTVTITGNTASFGLTQGNGGIIFKDHRGQGHDNRTVRINGNTLSAIGATGTGILLEGMGGSSIIADSNTIDMGGSGSALRILPEGCRPGHRLIFASVNSISNAANGIDVVYNDDTTGLNIPTDSLSFGALEFGGNLMTNVGSGIKITGVNPMWGNQGPTNRVRIRNNLLGGSFDGTFSSIEAIALDSVTADTIEIESNTISGFVTGIRNRSVTNVDIAHEHAPFGNRSASYSLNSITGTGADSGAGISVDVLAGVATLEGNVIDMNFNGTALKPRCVFIHGLGNDGPQLGILGNQISNSSTGCEVILDTDTTGTGTAPDSLASATIEIADNSMTQTRDGSRFKDHRGQGHDNLVINVKRNVLTGDASTGSVGLYLDSISLCAVEIDSNHVNNFETGALSRCRTGHHLCYMPGLVSGGLIVTRNIFTDCGSGMISELEPAFADDTIHALIENNVFSNNAGAGLELVVNEDSGFVDVVVTGNVFSGNSDAGFRAKKGNKSEFGNGNKFGFEKGHGHNNKIEPVAAGSGVRTRVSGMEFSPNEFVNNGSVGLYLDSAINVPDGIHYQNFSNNGSYNFFNGTADDINVEGCWWGTDDSAEIAAKIFDGSDSAGPGSCDFYPYLSDSITSSVTQTDLTLSAGWNIVSVPVFVGNFAKTALFPTAITQAFAYTGSYQSQPTLTNGAGYWIKCAAPNQQSFSGVTITGDSIDLTTGWNMIGSISASVPVESITSVPGGIVTTQFFRYAGSYSVTDSIRPGGGYWVKAAASGKLVLSTAPGLANNPAAIRIVPTGERPPAAPGNATESRLPAVFALAQNFPNPFNPATRIEIDLPVSSLLTLTVFDLLGREVSTVVIGKSFEAGTHQIEFDASDLSSGVYFYRMSAVATGAPKTEFTQMKRMVLVK